MTSGEGPGLGGYPDMKRPGTRAMQGYRAVWFALLVSLPRNLRTVQTVRKGLRTLPRKKA